MHVENKCSIHGKSCLLALATGLAQQDVIICCEENIQRNTEYSQGHSTLCTYTISAHSLEDVNVMEDVNLPNFLPNPSLGIIFYHAICMSVISTHAFVCKVPSSCSQYCDRIWELSLLYILVCGPGC